MFDRWTLTNGAAPHERLESISCGGSRRKKYKTTDAADHVIAPAHKQTVPFALRCETFWRTYPQRKVVVVNDGSADRTLSDDGGVPLGLVRAGYVPVKRTARGTRIVPE